jgi:hypothetical protein
MMGREAIERLCRRLAEERARTLRTIGQAIEESDLLMPSGTEDLSVLDILERIAASDSELTSGVVPLKGVSPVGPFLHPLYFIRVASEGRGRLLTELSQMTDDDLDRPYRDTGMTAREIVEELIADECEHLRPALERYIESKGN